MAPKAMEVENDPSRRDIRTSVVLLGLLGSLVGAFAGTSTYHHEFGVLEPTIVLSEYTIGWYSAADLDTSPNVYNPRIESQEFIFLRLGIDALASGPDTNRIWFEVRTSDGASTPTFYGFPARHYWGGDTTFLSEDIARYEGPLSPGHNSGGVGFSFSAKEGEYFFEIAVRVRGPRYRVEGENRLDEDNEKDTEAGSKGDKGMIEQGYVSDGSPLVLSEPIFVRELSKKWKVRVERDSAMIFDVTDGNSQLPVKKVYSRYLQWLHGKSPNELLGFLRHKGALYLDPNDSMNNVFCHWALALDTIQGSVERLRESFRNFRLYLIGEDSVAYITMAYQLVEEWDEAIDDCDSGKPFMIPYRDTLFYIDDIGEKLRSLTIKREAKIESEER